MSKLISVKNFVRNYFNKHPIISNGIIYGTLFLGAECSQQIMNKKILTDTPSDLDHATLLRYALYGIGVQGPLLTVWYRWLDNKYSGTALKIIAKKLAIDQGLCVPFILFLFYASMSLMEGKRDVLHEFKSKFPQTYKNSCMFWIPVNSINFIFVPAAFRVIYIGTASFAWINILCYIKRQEYD